LGDFGAAEAAAGGDLFLAFLADILRFWGFCQAVFGHFWDVKSHFWALKSH
jgi:hypothetical protein